MTDEEDNVVDLKLETLKLIADDLRALRGRVDDVGGELKTFRAEMHARFVRVDQRFDKIEHDAAILVDVVARERENVRNRFDRLEHDVMAGFDGVKAALKGVDPRFENLERRVSALEARRRR